MNDAPTHYEIPRVVLDDLAGLLAKAVRVGIACPDGWCALLRLKFFKEVEKEPKIFGFSCPINERGEVLRADLYLENRLVRVVLEPLSAKLLPLIEGLGKFSVHESANGFKVVRSDARQSNLHFDVTGQIGA